MSTIAAIRCENKVHEGSIQYTFRESGGKAAGQDFKIQENTNLVDGIGGVTWVSLDAELEYHKLQFVC